MGKRNRNEVNSTPDEDSANTGSKKSLFGQEIAEFDPSLASLFTSSAGPVQAPPKSRYSELPPPRPIDPRSDSEDVSNGDSQAEDEDDEELSSLDEDEDLDNADLVDVSEEEEDSDEEPQLEGLLETIQKPERKRKRRDQEEDLERKYMQKLVDAEEKEELERQVERRLKRQKVDAVESEEGSDKESAEEGAVAVRTVSADNPLHESLNPDTESSELEKAARTVFLANVCTSAITSKPDQKILVKHLESFLSSLPPPPEGKPAHKVESFRFRSTPYATPQLPKKAAFAKKDVREATTKSTNAYVVYSSAYVAREAVKKLNGTVVLDRHLRVDGVAHPAKTDHKRCVFVGNLGFVDDESMLEQDGENARKRSKIPSDIEEGLWRQFGKAGTVESVRVVRDEKTRVGKGFAYVQFHDANSVEAALLFNEKKYPPMLPRILRVVRAKPAKATALAMAASRDSKKPGKKPGKDQIYNPKVSSEASSLHGRAGRMLGKAGAAKLKSKDGNANNTPVGSHVVATKIEGVAKTPEKIIFEGHRATAKSGKPKDLKMGGKKGGKPKTKSARRAASWKTGGKNKGKQT